MTYGLWFNGDGLYILLITVKHKVEFKIRIIEFTIHRDPFFTRFKPIFSKFQIKHIISLILSSLIFFLLQIFCNGVSNMTILLIKTVKNTIFPGPLLLRPSNEKKIRSTQTQKALYEKAHDQIKPFNNRHKSSNTTYIGLSTNKIEKSFSHWMVNI